MKKKISRQETDEYLVEGWSKVYGVPMSSADVSEINYNLSAFVDVMSKIDNCIETKRQK